MKYIIFRRKLPTLTVEHPIIFPNHLVHAQVADSLMDAGGPLQGFKPVRAGELTIFATLNDRVISCHGESTTLRLKSDPDDAYLIAMHDYGAGFS